MSTETCIEQCQDLEAECSQASEHAVTLEADPELIAILQDCARVAEATAGLLQRLPELRGMTARVCADVCEECAEACEALPDDETLSACAQAARACAEACRSLAATATETEEAEERAGEETEAEVSSFEFMHAEPVELAPAEHHR